MLLNLRLNQVSTKPVYRYVLKELKCAGNVLAFDNKRLIHGRLAYEDSPNNQRLLVGCYLDWDEIYSKLRVLQGELRQQGV